MALSLHQMNATNKSSREIKKQIQLRLEKAKFDKWKQMQRDREYEEEERQRIESEEDYYESRGIDPYGDEDE